ncbi:uncharacterized protein LOC106180975 isoform X1 [Lingula anatina]|uniref:Uncharacterized protein LOC106180975 isoform X1 n=1 Tax=Lingula anatina TaxID=7574 RepID=A0A1S3KDV0_LINAN|nr:uncharacterized protein LOC106180975 isoform X1 [Lingula anatina]|eukprot:XP_013420629.1 uncharacterized protein LOC106180975 isoform X1 [Lingula anatina]
MGQQGSKTTSRHPVSHNQSGRHHLRHHPHQHHILVASRNGPHPARRLLSSPIHQTGQKKPITTTSHSMFKPVVTGKVFNIGDDTNCIDPTHDNIETSQMKNLAKHRALHSVERLFNSVKDGDGLASSEDNRFNTSEIELMELGTRGALERPPFEQQDNWSFQTSSNNTGTEANLSLPQDISNIKNPKKPFVKNPIISGELFMQPDTKDTASEPKSQTDNNDQNNENETNMHKRKQFDSGVLVKDDILGKKVMSTGREQTQDQNKVQPKLSDDHRDSDLPQKMNAIELTGRCQTHVINSPLHRDHMKKNEKVKKKKKKKKAIKRDIDDIAESSKKDTCKGRFFFNFGNGEQLSDQKAVYSLEQVVITKNPTKENQLGLTDLQNVKELGYTVQKSNDNQKSLHNLSEDPHQDAVSEIAISLKENVNIERNNWIQRSQDPASDQKCVDNEDYDNNTKACISANLISVRVPDDPDPMRLHDQCQLVQAAGAGDLDWLRKLLCSGVNPNSNHPMNRNTALHYAVGLDYNTAASMVSLLLQYGADPNLCNYSGATPLHEAIIHQQTCCVDMLVANGSNVNAIWTSANTTPINLAIHCGNPDIVRTLLRKGAKMQSFVPQLLPNNSHQGIHNIPNQVQDCPLRILVQKWKARSSSERCATILRTLIEGENDVVKCLKHDVSLWSILNKLHDSKHGHFATLELITIILEMGYRPTVPERSLIKTIDKSKHDWMLDYLSSAPPLSDLCRRAVRRALWPNVLYGVDRLSVTDQVKDQLLLLQESTEL